MTKPNQDFAQRYMSTRDGLAWRVAQGQPLSEIERAMLQAIDTTLDALEGPPTPLSPEVQAIVQRYAGRFANGHKL